jgi:hypothetical protein
VLPFDANRPSEEGTRMSPALRDAEVVIGDDASKVV